MTNCPNCGAAPERLLRHSPTIRECARCGLVFTVRQDDREDAA
ncbi:MAG: hypothetical protein WCF04_00170 [Candidatus Nanopelagicales bacterium]